VGAVPVRFDEKLSLGGIGTPRGTVTYQTTENQSADEASGMLREENPLPFAPTMTDALAFETEGHMGTEATARMVAGFTKPSQRNEEERVI